MYITAPPVNYSILCLSSIVHIVAFVNLLLKKMVVVVVELSLRSTAYRPSDKGLFSHVGPIQQNPLPRSIYITFFHHNVTSALLPLPEPAAITLYRFYTDFNLYKNYVYML